MYDPLSMSPGSIMPAYPWLIRDKLNVEQIPKKIKVLRTLGTPYANCKDESVVGTGNIEEKCNSIAKEYYGSKIDIKSVDSQFVTSSDITILTSGEIKFHNSTTVVPFIQSFYLEQNKNQSRSYSIR
jgi:cbb3-type cytochrome oxidase cytochrome c subunit